MDADVVVIGAGQAGLSAAFGLRRAGFEPGSGFVVLDGEDGPGGAWRHRWPTLRMATVHGLYDLPGLPRTGSDPARPASEVVPAYFADYEREFDLRVLRPVHVAAVRDDRPHLLVETDRSTWRTRALINATGTWTRPFRPLHRGQASFRGRQLHTVEYRDPAEFAGLRVIVVGGGTSAVQALLEIEPVAASTTWVTRRPPVFHDGPFDAETGRAAVARVEERVRAGLPPQSVVSATGLPAAAAALPRRPMFERIEPDGVVWADGTSQPADVILWATGWRAELGHLAPLRLRGPGGGITMDGTRVAADPRVHLVGTAPAPARSVPTAPDAPPPTRWPRCWLPYIRAVTIPQPAWQRETKGEHRWPAVLAVVAAIVLQVLLPDQMTLGSRWLLPGLEALILLILLVTNPFRIDRESTVLRVLGIGLAIALTLATAVGVVNLVAGIVSGRFGNDATALLATGGSIWLTNVIAFGFLFWEYDRGGPAARASGRPEHPDFLFPQMQSPDMADHDWEPQFVDYLYVAFTNATAFSPTDTMPLSHWAKTAMMAQSATSLVTVALVVARAVNVLK